MQLWYMFIVCGEVRWVCVTRWIHSMYPGRTG